MIHEAAVVIVGSGALGSSVAYHLAKAGVGPVALLDKHGIASQTSPRAAGLTSQMRSIELCSSPNTPDAPNSSTTVPKAAARMPCDFFCAPIIF